MISLLFERVLSLIYFSCIICVISASSFNKYVDSFKAFTVATNETDGYRQFLRSTKTYNIHLEVLGFGKRWKGGDMNRAGGGFKVNLFKEALEPYKDNDNQIIIFTDSYDVLYLASPSVIIKKFLLFDAKIVFSAEPWIWPDTSLKDKYPEVTDGYRFLNSGAFMGFASSIYRMLQHSTLNNDDDDQLFYTKIYLDENVRNTLNIKLDHKSVIFQNLFATTDDLTLLPKGNIYELYNVKYDTKPCVLHGNGLSKQVEFRTISNYLAGRWKSDEGCQDCDEAIINLENISLNEYPTVVIGIFIARPTPFLKEFMEKIFRQNYPRRKISLFVHNMVPYHQAEIDDLLLLHRDKYADFKLIKDTDSVDIVTAKELALKYCVRKSCGSYLNVDSDAHLDNKETLFTLVKQNRSIIGPLLIRPYKAWSNFWGALDKEGYYKRSFDYMDIVNFKRKSIWNIPYLSSCYLINGTILNNAGLMPVYSHEKLDYDMAFCDDIRKKGIYMYVDNRQDYGHLSDLDGFDITRTNPNVYELIRNRFDWERAYLHPEYQNNFEPNRTHLQPCPDVYWFPIVSDLFCKEFIEIMEAFGKWSDGSNTDTRLKGGYEAVPTRDIHMNQVGLEEQWLEFLRLYVNPLQEMVFIGYYHSPPRSLMNFVVRYKPDEQPSLRPHHDSSTYTINIALNRPNIDYEGGGCKFMRYDCKVVDMKLGWMLMHPGRLTHFHEGLLVTKGVRYIMISFVDP